MLLKSVLLPKTVDSQIKVFKFYVGKVVFSAQLVSISVAYNTLFSWDHTPFAFCKILQILIPCSVLFNTAKQKPAWVFPMVGNWKFAQTANNDHFSKQRSNSIVHLVVKIVSLKSQHVQRECETKKSFDF